MTLEEKPSEGGCVDVVFISLNDGVMTVHLEVTVDSVRPPRKNNGPSQPSRTRGIPEVTLCHPYQTNGDPFSNSGLGDKSE